MEWTQYERALTTLWPDSGDGSSGKSRAYVGADTWYRDEVYFPAGFQASQNTLVGILPLDLDSVNLHYGRTSQKIEGVVANSTLTLSRSACRVGCEHRY